MSVSLYNDFLKKGFDQEQAKILVAIQPHLEAALNESKAISESASKLADLVAKYESKWPEIMYRNGGSRARAAMEFVLKGSLVSLGVDQAGNDLWSVGGHTCSKRGKRCSCDDEQTYTDPRFGRLCKHRIAVALKDNWLGDINEALFSYLQTITGDMQGPYMDLLVVRVYDYHNEGNRAAVAGYWKHGMHGHTRLSPVDEIEFTLPQFQYAAQKLGLLLVDLPIKLPGFSDYYYRIAKQGDALAITEQAFWYRGRTWRMEDRERMRKIQLIDIALHVDAFLSGKITIPISGYEAHRVMQIKEKIDSGETSVFDLLQALPDALQVSLLESI